MRAAWLRRLVVVAVGLNLLAGAVAAVADDPLDPLHNTPLACEFLSTPGAVPRSAHDIAHLANVCGFVGTDVEFQSRTAADGTVHDYAFLGTMGFGLRIFDVTDPAHPFSAGQFTDPGWQNDVQVRGDVAVVGIDPVSGVNPSLSVCLQSKLATGGADIIALDFDPTTATFQTGLIDCVPNTPGGAHNSTLHPSGDWLAFSNPRSNGTVDVVDLRGPTPVLLYRIIGTPTPTICGQAAGGCIARTNPSGNWSPHDIHFSEDGNTMYVAAVGNDTVLMDVSGVLSGTVSTISVVPNLSEPGGLSNPRNIQISHQSDVSSDGKILVITDERGGGLQEASCNTNASGVIGGAHFWALAEIVGVPESSGASPATPKKLGTWFYPQTFPVDPLAPVLPRTERACTIHVFRLGGNGTASPGPAEPGFDGVSGLPDREAVTAHYGAGVWHFDFSSASDPGDGLAEDPRSTWANTLGWNIMPGAETWSAKEYKGHIYAGDMVRGFDVYRFTDCDDVTCVVPPAPNTPGKATGGGQVPGELALLTILSGTNAGGRANFGFNASFELGILSGHLTFIDHGAKKEVKSIAIDSYTQLGNKASFTGRATVDGVPSVRFFVEVEDLGEPGTADTFRIVLGDGYAAGGVLLKGNIQVHQG